MVIRFTHGAARPYVRTTSPKSKVARNKRAKTLRPGPGGSLNLLDLYRLDYSYNGKATKIVFTLTYLRVQHWEESPDHGEDFGDVASQGNLVDIAKLEVWIGTSHLA